MCKTSLLPSATATVYLDGLIFLLPNIRSRMCQALIHIGAEHHALQIEISDCGNAEHKEGHDHQHAMPLSAPRPSKKLKKLDCTSSVSLYKPRDLTAERSFGHVLDFETRLYDHRLDFHANPPAVELNFLHGTFYSATNMKVMLKSFAAHESSMAASTVETITSSVLVGVDFDAKSGAGGKRYLVMEQSNPSNNCTRTKEIFRLELEEGKHYIVKLNNIPVKGSHGAHHNSPEHHFLKYYELFSLREGEKFFFVKVPDAPEGHHHPPLSAKETELSPPCNVGTGTQTGCK
jgi:hypothetical protein